MTEITPSVLAVITARGGSKGLPGKNIRPLAGRPLISWSIAAALGARCISRVIVSTDAPEIAEVARAAGAEVPFLRPPELASDIATSTDVILHTLGKCPEHTVFALLQPTSPLRSSADIDAAFAQMQAAGAESCVSVVEVGMSPWLMFRLDEENRLERLLPEPQGSMRRQDLPTVYALNGAIYFASVEGFLRTGKLVTNKTVAYVMNREISVDIDTEEDFKRAEEILALMRGRR